MKKLFENEFKHLNDKKKKKKAYLTVNIINTRFRDQY